MGHHQRPGVGAEQPRQRLQAQGAIPLAGDAGDLHPLLLQLAEGAHDGVVLHGGGEHVVARPQQALEQDVHGRGDAAGENDVFRLVKAQQPAQLFPGVQHHLGGGIGLLIAAPADVDPHLFDKIRHGLPHAGRFGKGCAAVVQIDLVHRLALLSLCGFFTSIPQSGTRCPLFAILFFNKSKKGAYFNSLYINLTYFVSLSSLFQSK